MCPSCSSCPENLDYTTDTEIRQASNPGRTASLYFHIVKCGVTDIISVEFLIKVYGVMYPLLPPIPPCGGDLVSHHLLQFTRQLTTSLTPHETQFSNQSKNLIHCSYFVGYLIYEDYLRKFFSSYE